MGLYIPSFAEIQEVAADRGARSRAPELWEGLVGCWPLQEGGGATAYDASGWGNDGTLTNMDPATDWVTTPNGTGLDFDKSNDYIDIIASGTQLDFPGAFTISILMEPRSPGTGQQTLFLKSRNPENAAQYAVDIVNSTGKIGFYLISLLPYPLVTSASAITTSTRRVDVTFDGVGTGTVYVDGVFSASGTKSSGTYATQGNTSLSIGAFETVAAHAQYFDGRIISVEARKGQLSASQFSHLYANPWDHLSLRRRVYPAVTSTPLNLADDSFENTAPFDDDEEIGTVTATGGTESYTYSITAQSTTPAMRRVIEFAAAPSPDVRGAYFANGTYGGQAAYERDDSAYWKWWDGSKWVLSVAKGDKTGAYWDSSLISAIYTAQNGASNNVIAYGAVPFTIGAATGVITIDDSVGLAAGQEWSLAVHCDDGDTTDDATITVTLSAASTGSNKSRFDYYYRLVGAA